MPFRILVVLLVVSLAGSGCRKENGATNASISKDLIDSSITEFHNLGWLGAQSHPLSTDVTFSDPGDAEATVTPGGLVIRDVAERGAAANAGLQVGDVIVGVEATWLPIKDDPTLDFIQDLETRVSAGETKTDLQILRNGELQSITISNPSKSLDDGLPSQVERFAKSTELGLDHLATLQQADGSFGDPECNGDERLQTTALCGLSFLAGGAEKYSENIEKCKTFLAGQIDRVRKPSKETKADEAAEKKKTSPGPQVMQIQAVEMEPLASAYLLQFWPKRASR